MQAKRTMRDILRSFAAGYYTYDKDELHEEAYEAHDNKAQGCPSTDLAEFCTADTAASASSFAFEVPSAWQPAVGATWASCQLRTQAKIFTSSIRLGAALDKTHAILRKFFEGDNNRVHTGGRPLLLSL